MGALELLLDVAYHDGSPRDLAIAAEAWTIAGYHDDSISIAHSGRQEQLLERVAAARRGRRTLLLRSRARGIVAAFTALAETGVISYAVCAEARRWRWGTRGGHDHKAAG